MPKIILNISTIHINDLSHQLTDIQVSNVLQHETAAHSNSDYCPTNWLVNITTMFYIAIQMLAINIKQVPFTTDPLPVTQITIDHGNQIIE